MSEIMGNSWAEKSSQTVEVIMNKIQEHLDQNGLSHYKVTHRLSGFNDAFTVVGNADRESSFYFISVIIGWMWADAELALVHQINPQEYALATDTYFEIDNSKLTMPVERKSEDIVNNKIKYYESPFMDRIDNVVNDVISGIKILEAIQGGN
jgi:hypothetical protein